MFGLFSGVAGFAAEAVPRILALEKSVDSMLDAWPKTFKAVHDYLERRVQEIDARHFEALRKVEREAEVRSKAQTERIEELDSSHRNLTELTLSLMRQTERLQDELNELKSRIPNG